MSVSLASCPRCGGDVLRVGEIPATYSVEYVCIQCSYREYEDIPRDSSFVPSSVEKFSSILTKRNVNADHRTVQSVLSCGLCAAVVRALKWGIIVDTKVADHYNANKNMIDIALEEKDK